MSGGYPVASSVWRSPHDLSPLIVMMSLESPVVQVARKGDTRTGVGRCSGTFGELLQGVLPDQKREILVTLPITRCSTVRFTTLPGFRDVHTFPSHKEKSRRLAEKLIQILGLEAGGVLHVQSELPEGKGLASSSADMVATALAIQSAFDLSLSPAILARVMSSIEPSDGVMYQGIVSFYHREGMLRKLLGYPPSLTIVALDEGGQVDTLDFNEWPKPFSQAKREEYENLLIEIERAVTRGDLASVGEISTRSAIMNQEILPKAHLDLLLDMRKRYDALGVVVAHSGTHLGLLLDPNSADHLRKLPAIVAELRQHSPDVSIYHSHDFRKALGVSNCTSGNCIGRSAKREAFSDPATPGS
jgi:uncharacterized protein involved in propanediol utilization